MAKKSRRTRKPKLSKTQLVRPSRSGAKATPVEEAAPTTPGAPASFAEEYRYVIGDLKTIGILAAGMLGGLVVLSFLL